MANTKSLLHQFRPTLRARGIQDVTPAFLAQRGMSALILDLDNTLVPWHGREIAPHVAEWIASMQEAGVRMCIVSNTHRPKRLAELAQLLGISFVPSGGKPRRRGFLRAMVQMQSTADTTAVIGDQVMTDIWGGNRCGLLTILVDPMSPIEFVGTRVISRNVERLLLRLLERTGAGSDRL